MTLVIMAAGMGSRFGGLKQLTPLTDDGEYIIDFTVYDAVRAGFDKIIFIIRREHEEIFEEKVGAHMRAAGVNIEYRYQDMTLPGGRKFPEGRTKPFGTGHALMCAGDIGDCFAVCNSDDFYGAEPFAKLHGFLKDANSGQWCMVGYKVKNTLSPTGPVSRGVCMTENGMLKKITEYKKIERRNGVVMNTFDDGTTETLSEDQLVSMTCFGFTPDFAKSLPSMFEEFLDENASDLSKCEFFLPSAVQEMLDKNEGSLAVMDTDSEWKGVTYREDSDEFREFIRALKKDGKYPKKLW
ncbi:MAG: NTP transferase domain-containing protein [Clostridiales bacterium]|nr:NTP transferase domain-containing protein [Clostridiales bacterium]